PGEVVYVGESIGCSVAMGLSVERAPAALVLQSGALDLGDVAADAYPFLPARALMRDRFLMRDHLAEFSFPILCVHGSRDRIVPMKYGREIHDGAPGPKEWLEIEAGHNDITYVGGTRYIDAVDAFLSRFLAKKSR
ncbi:MAG: alpha/beta hydrolase, partial [Planctomycetota bacterium]|nr:alpha/beta hydrolase [Planctomycetota bacterium]